MVHLDFDEAAPVDSKRDRGLILSALTMEDREGALVITRLPIEQMGLLTLGLALTGKVKAGAGNLFRRKKLRPHWGHRSGI